MTGPNFATVSACATGGHAIGEAFETIRRDDADVMLAGGSEAGIYETLVGGFASMRALSTRNEDPPGASRPFDVERDGFVCGEGAGVLVLEELSHAEARGAQPLAELVGYGATADASHITLPAPGGIGAVRAARRALEKAGVSADGSTTSTPTRRRRRKATRPSSRRSRRSSASARGAVPVTANKSMIGHTLGAAGAIESIVTVMTIRESCIPPTINLDQPDPEAEGMTIVTDEAVRARGRSRAVELVRVRRTEHRARLPAVGRMTDDLRPAMSAAGRGGHQSARWQTSPRRPTAATSSCFG